MNLQTLTSPEVKSCPRDKTVIFLPIGSTEQHGPHLPLGTKGFIAEALAFETVARLKTDNIFGLVAPTFPYASCQVSFGFPGTFSISARVFSDVIYEIGQSVQREGFKYFFLVNTCLSPESLKATSVAIDDLNKLKNFQALDPMSGWLFSKKPLIDDALRQRDVDPESEIHADIKETSAMLYLDHELVDAESSRKLAAKQINIGWETLKGNFSYQEKGADQGYLGTPGKADSALGKMFIDEAGAFLANTVQLSMRRENVPGLPLPLRMFLKLIDLDEAG